MSVSSNNSSGWTNSQGHSESTGTGSSSGQSQSGSYIPDFEQQLDFLNQFGNTAGQIGAQQYDWAQDQWGNNSQLTDQNVNDYLRQSDLASQGAERDYQNYNDIFNPAASSLTQDWQSYTSPERVASEMGASEANVAQNFDKQREGIESGLRSYGVNPSDPRYAGAMAANRTAQAAAEAGAGTAARINTENTGRQLRGQALNEAHLLPGQQATQQNVAMQGNTGAQNAAMSNTSLGALTMGTAPQWNQIGGTVGTRYQPLGNQSTSSNQANNNSRSTSDNSSQGQNQSQGSSSGPAGGGGSGQTSPSRTPTGSMPSGSAPQSYPSSQPYSNPNQTGARNVSNPYYGQPTGQPTGGGTPGSGQPATDPWSNYGDPYGSNGGSDPFGSGYPGGTNTPQDWSNPGDPGYTNQPSGYTDPNTVPDSGNWGYTPPTDYSWGDSYAEGGAIPDGDGDEGGYVDPGMSPSGGEQVDDIPAQIGQDGGQARLNAGEFVIPQDTVEWLGHKFFQDLIAKSRKARQADPGPAHPTMDGGVQEHDMGGPTGPIRPGARAGQPYGLNPTADMPATRPGAGGQPYGLNPTADMPDPAAAPTPAPDPTTPDTGAIPDDNPAPDAPTPDATGSAPTDTTAAVDDSGMQRPPVAQPQATTPDDTPPQDPTSPVMPRRPPMRPPQGQGRPPLPTMRAYQQGNRDQAFHPRPQRPQPYYQRPNPTQRYPNPGWQPVANVHPGSGSGSGGPPVMPQQPPVAPQPPPTAPTPTPTPAPAPAPVGNGGALAGPRTIMTGTIVRPPPNITQGVGAYRQFAAGGSVPQPRYYSPPRPVQRAPNPGWRNVPNVHPMQQQQAPQQSQPQMTVTRQSGLSPAVRASGSITSPFAPPVNPGAQPPAQQSGGYHPLGGQVDADPNFHPASQGMGGHVSSWFVRGGAIPDDK